MTKKKTLTLKDFKDYEGTTLADRPHCATKVSYGIDGLPL